MNPPVRIGAVDYLNVRPLVADAPLHVAVHLPDRRNLV